jgi:hypothetical protein
LTVSVVADVAVLVMKVEVAVVAVTLVFVSVAVPVVRVPDVPVVALTVVLLVVETHVPQSTLQSRRSWGPATAFEHSATGNAHTDGSSATPLQFSGVVVTVVVVLVALVLEAVMVVAVVLDDVVSVTVVSVTWTHESQSTGHSARKVSPIPAVVQNESGTSQPAGSARPLQVVLFVDGTVTDVGDTDEDDTVDAVSVLLWDVVVSDDVEVATVAVSVTHVPHSTGHDVLSELPRMGCLQKDGSVSWHCASSALPLQSDAKVSVVAVTVTVADAVVAVPVTTTVVLVVDAQLSHRIGQLCRSPGPMIGEVHNDVDKPLQ